MLKSRRLATVQHRVQIKATAMHLFKTHGVGQGGGATIMKQVDLTHSGFYNHFASKEALVVHTCRQSFHATAKARAA